MHKLRENERFVNMNYETAMVLSACLGIKFEDELEEGETVNMCKAWDDHWKSGERAGESKARANSVHNLMETMQWSMEKAMEALKVPKEQQAEIVKMLQSA